MPVSSHPVCVVTCVQRHLDSEPPAKNEVSWPMWRSRLGLAKGVASGLDYLHSKSCCHGNLKRYLITLTVYYVSLPVQNVSLPVQNVSLPVQNVSLPVLQTVGT